MAQNVVRAGALFVVVIGLLMLGLNALSSTKSAAFQSIGSCLLIAGVVAVLLGARTNRR